MKQLALAVGLLFLSGTALAQTDLQQQQLNKNANRRSRQAEAIKQVPQEQKADAAKKAHERNQNVKGRQKDINQEINQNH